jgi:hypothetical protein
MNGARMAEAARRISLENLHWVSGEAIDPRDLDGIQALCGNRPLPLDEALGFEFPKRRLPEVVESLLDGVWKKAPGSARVGNARRWARRWTAAALLRRAHRLLVESASASGGKRSDGIRAARFLAWTALRIGPSALGGRKEAGIALRALVGRA